MIEGQRHCTVLTDGMVSRRTISLAREIVCQKAPKVFSFFCWGFNQVVDVCFNLVIFSYISSKYIIMKLGQTSWSQNNFYLNHTLPPNNSTWFDAWRCIIRNLQGLVEQCVENSKHPELNNQPLKNMICLFCAFIS